MDSKVINDIPYNQPVNSNQNENKTKKKRTVIKDNDTRFYRGFTLFVHKSESEKKLFRGEVLNPESHQANNQLGPPIFEANGKDMEIVFLELRKFIDSKEESAVMSIKESVKNLVAENNVETTSEKSKKNPMPLEENNNNIILGSTAENTILVEGKTNNTSELKQIVEKDYGSVHEQNEIIQLLSSLTKDHARLIKDVDSINRRLDRISSNVNSIQNEVLPENQTPSSFLARINRTIKSSIEEWRKEHNEEKQIRDEQIRRLLVKINTAAQADHVDEHLANLQIQSKNLHSRLDAKIDLQDAQKILELRSEMERFVRDDLIRSMSKIIMPVVDILKDQVQDRDTTIVAIVNDLEQRCKQAGLKSSDLF